eukprot:CAMPEP_0180146106 /NCGR_PEP_ID=MMETSP0986-20121125/18228_1 /TAXON_ID=697907 /ORGANISM="non described non described, Strain CCMP2293" /LENGTH=52 /DNA_ID=CAMNT_0022090931 /DNA_START=89 /DNA_END=243 /DNA_ORIENTATION=-
MCLMSRHVDATPKGARGVASSSVPALTMRSAFRALSTLLIWKSAAVSTQLSA